MAPAPSIRQPLPKYHVIKSVLRAHLQREYTVGARLPSELDLCRHFRVSRVTVQQALALLEREGLVSREQGRGTFYLGEPDRTRPARLSGLLESVMKYDDGAFARVLRKQTIPASPRIATRLAVPAYSPVVFIERLGIIGGGPIVLIAAHLPPEIGSPLLHDDDELNQRKAIVSILQDKYGVSVASVTQTIAATSVDPVAAEHLAVEVGEPVLEVERTYFDSAGRPVNFSVSFYRTDRFRFEITMKEWR